ncbi:hypothetical protein J3U92_16615 [Proteus mirabilis]|nr:hypothetical protein [Proteus mirabilis]UTA57596.1 hypothetical protein J3U92_16615 [Proteus mirabilis]SPY38054.1 NgoFVII restriction endonuclease [Proteus mirabilis]
MHMKKNIELWSSFPKEKKDEYIKFLEIFGALSGLFKDTAAGSSADKPYLYYRNHEQLFARVFDVEDLTRKDSAFDAIAKMGKNRIGVGLKTWIHSRDKTFQKVAEFNKVAPTEIRPLIDKGTPLDVVKKVALLRNKRIELDQRTYKTTHTIYHNITRDSNVMNIVECSYDLIDLDSIKIISVNDNKGVFNFKDKNKKYKFNVSKSVLYQEFDASSELVVTKVPITQFKDPFELLSHIHVTDSSISKLAPRKEKIEDPKKTIYLPIYSDSSMKVEEKSGFNAWNAAPKTKGSNKLRPDFEAYIPIPIWIHHIFPHFFGFNALDKEERNAAKGFELQLPDDRIITAIVTQDNGKSLQTNPQSILGKWILHDVFGLKARELLTMDMLNELGVDSVKVTKVNDNKFKIDLADTSAFEQWKLGLKTQIENCDNIKQKPKFREDLIEE